MSCEHPYVIGRADFKERESGRLNQRELGADNSGILSALEGTEESGK